MFSAIRKDLNSIEANRIHQGDIFSNVEIIESISMKDSDTLRLKKISFPLVVCLNQDCDLASDYSSHSNRGNGTLLHLIVAPLFHLGSFRDGKQWGDILSVGDHQNSEKMKRIKQNSEYRYHYLAFLDDSLPELVVDFKYFFTISRDSLYNQLSKRVCSIDELFRESLSQRFAYYISRIGLPEIEK